MKGIFGNLFFYFKPKNEFRNFEFCFSSFFWNRLHQNLFWLFWEVGSKIELKLLYHWIKLFKTFTVVGWRLNMNIISMYKIDFYFFFFFFENPLIRNKKKSEGKLPKRKTIFSAYYQKLLQRKWFAFKIFSKPCHLLEQVWKRYNVLLLLLVYFLITTGL